MAWSRERMMIGVSLVTSCLLMLDAGTIYAFTAYLNAIKKSFNYSQTDMEIMAAFGNLGVSLGWPAGFICERLGQRVTTLVALVLTTTSFFLLYSTTLHEEFYSQDRMVALQDVYFFLAGLGCNFSYMAGVTTSFRNVGRQHLGRVMGVLDAFFSVGPGLFTLIYGTVFIRGHDSDEQNQDLGGFYLMSAVVAAVANLLGVVGLSVRTPTPLELHTSTSQLLNGTNSNHYDSSHDVKTDSKDDATDASGENEVTGMKLLRQFDFHFLLWSFIFNGSLQLTFQTNITTYLKSARLEQHATLLTTLSFVLTTVFKLALGLLSDITVKHVPRAVLVLVPTGVQTLTLAGCIMWSDSLPMLLAATLIVALANGATWCLTPVMTSHYFGARSLGQNWGGIMMGLAGGAFLLQQAFGQLYQREIHEAGALDCYGTRCFTLSFLVLTTFSACATILYLGLLERRWQLRKKGRQSNDVDMAAGETTR